MGSGFSKMKKQAKQMQAQYEKFQKEMDAMEILGDAGNGLVKITINGDKKIKKIDIQPDCVDPNDVEGLQDLIIAAFDDAITKLKDKTPLDSLGMGF